MTPSPTAKVTDATPDYVERAIGIIQEHFDLRRSNLLAAIGAGGQAVAWWHVGKWGNGTSCADESNIFCDAWETAIAENLPTEIAEAIVEAHNAALAHPSPAIPVKDVERVLESHTIGEAIINASNVADETLAIDGKQLTFAPIDGTVSINLKKLEALLSRLRAGPQEGPHRFLKDETSDWETDREEGKVTVHSRVVDGVLCRWWGDGDAPGGVAKIDAAAPSPEVKGGDRG